MIKAVETHAHMRVRGKLGDTMERVPCIDGGNWHAWIRQGLDVWRGKLVAVRTCSWCEKTERRTPKPHPHRTYVH